jgi:enoyl-CoA hydratase/carnithine racemase
LDRPDYRNALNTAVLERLEAAIDDIDRKRDEVRLTLLTGNGPSFCAGADLEERQETRSYAEKRRIAERWHDLFERFESLPHPTIASVHGAAIGGGLLLALTCDLRVASDDFVAALPEVAMGVAPSGAGIPRLIREIGLPRARDLVLTGRRLSAREALDWSIVTQVVAAEDLATTTEALVQRLLGFSPNGLHIATRALRAITRLSGFVDAAWSDPELTANR